MYVSVWVYIEPSTDTLHAQCQSILGGFQWLCQSPLGCPMAWGITLTGVLSLTF